MKIAIVTDDGKSVSAHFGRAAYFAVIEIAGGQVAGRELREKPSHQGHRSAHGQAGSAEIAFQEPTEVSPPQDTHGGMTAVIADCQMAVARGMGSGMFQRLREAGIEPVLTDAREVDEVVRLHLSGELVHRPERLH